MQEPFFLGFLSVVVAFAAIYAAAAFVFAAQMPRFSSLRWIGTAYASYAAAFSCYTSTATGLIVAGNVLWIAGVAAFAEGLGGLLHGPVARIRRAQRAAGLLLARTRRSPRRRRIVTTSW